MPPPEPTPVDAQSLVDARVVAELRDAVGNDDVALRHILATWAEDAPRQARLLAAAAEGGDAATMERAAHRLRGASATVGAQAVAGACSTVEEALRCRDLARAAGAARTVPRLVEHTARALSPRVGPTPG